jgi:hypothetical protein
MAIAIRSNGQISYPFLSACALTTALGVHEAGPEFKILSVRRMTTP